MIKLIISLIRKRLGLKKFQRFRFVGQKSFDVYFFTETSLMKKTVNGLVCNSEVSLNWLLDKDCAVIKYENSPSFSDYVKGLMPDGD